MKNQISAPFAATLAIATVSLTISAARAEDYNQICGNTKSISTQKGQYCSAAKTSLDAAKKEKTLTMIYAAVAGTCAASCAGWLTTAYICEGASLGAAAADALITQNFTNSLMSAGLAAYNLMDGEGGAAGASKNGSKKFMCWATAAMAAVNSATHAASKSNEEKSAQSNLASAKQVNDSANNDYHFTSGTTPVTTGSAPTVALNGSNPTSANLSEGGSSDPAQPCAMTDTVGGATTCAATADPNVAGLVASPEFQKAFEKSSGMSLDQFLKNGGSLSPKDAIQASAGAALGVDGTAKLGKALAGLENVQPNLNGGGSTTYAAAGGHKSSGSGDDDLANMMNGLMGKLMPKSEDDKKSGVSQLNFGGAARNLASVTAEDRSVSLFERVAFRYSHVTPRLLAEPAKRTLSDWSQNNPMSYPAGSAANQRN